MIRRAFILDVCWAVALTFIGYFLLPVVAASSGRLGLSLPRSSLSILWLHVFGNFLPYAFLGLAMGCAMSWVSHTRESLFIFLPEIGLFVLVSCWFIVYPVSFGYFAKWLVPSWTLCLAFAAAAGWFVGRLRPQQRESS